MYHERKEVYMPERAEVTSDKYTNMRYNDKSSTNVDLDDFLVKAYAKQIKELNSSTAMARVGLIHAAVSRRTSPHTPMDNMSTRYNPIRLLKGAPPGQELVNHYASELAIHKNKRLRRNICEAHHLVEIDAYNKY